jgi:hypothetical protein
MDFHKKGPDGTLCLWKLHHYGARLLREMIRAPA